MGNDYAGEAIFMAGVKVSVNLLPRLGDAGAGNVYMNPPPQALTSRLPPPPPFPYILADENHSYPNATFISLGHE